jgi:hypothetical protein
MLAVVAALKCVNLVLDKHSEMPRDDDVDARQNRIACNLIPVSVQIRNSGRLPS